VSIQIVEVESQSITEDIRKAFSLAAAEKFLEGKKKKEFLRKLGDISESITYLAENVAFSPPYYNPSLVVAESRYRLGAVVVPTHLSHPETGLQEYYAVYLTS
jgi:hypothetical protein